MEIIENLIIDVKKYDAYLDDSDTHYCYSIGYYKDSGLYLVECSGLGKIHQSKSFKNCEAFLLKHFKKEKYIRCKVIRLDYRPK